MIDDSFVSVTVAVLLFLLPIAYSRRIVREPVDPSTEIETRCMHALVHFVVVMCGYEIAAGHFPLVKLFAAIGFEYSLVIVDWVCDVETNLVLYLLESAALVNVSVVAPIAPHAFQFAAYLVYGISHAMVRKPDSHV